mgnify:CR=1 FL=1
MAEKRIVAAVMGNGRIGLVEQEVPPVAPGTVLVEVHASLVSPGTELGGWRALRAQQERPDPNARPRPFGYANAGVVARVGEGVTRFQVGDRVACMGGGYALHTDWAVVPHHLCVPLPDNVTYAQGSYGHLAATALHALRRGQPEFGEYMCVVGLGLVGQLAAQLHRLAGGYVIGWDTIPFRTETALACGIHAVALVGEEDEVAKTQEFTRGAGLDGALFAFGGDGTKALQSVRQCLKRTADGHPMGRIVIVGGVKLGYTFGLTNADIREASRTGPGYHDEVWEVGADYPPAVMRWTTRTNLELCLRLIAEGRLNVDRLTTHTIPLQEVEAGVSAITHDPDRILGVVFEPRR